MSPILVICLLTKLKCPPPFSHKSSASLTLRSCVFRTGKCLFQVNFSSKQVKCPCLTGLVQCAHIQVKCLPTQVKCMSPYSGRIPSHRGQVNVSPFKSNSFPQRSSECPLPPIQVKFLPTEVKRMSIQVKCPSHTVKYPYVSHIGALLTQVKGISQTLVKCPLT